MVAGRLRDREAPRAGQVRQGVPCQGEDLGIRNSHQGKAVLGRGVVLLLVMARMPFGLPSTMMVMFCGVVVDAGGWVGGWPQEKNALRLFRRA